MKSKAHFCSLFSVALLVAASFANAVDLPDLETGYGPPPGWDGPVFRLSKAYPSSTPAAEPQPWRKIGVADPVGYLQALLTYSFEGNLDGQSADPTHFDEQFQVAANPIRKWFHAPWMHVGRHPREFIHGLTDERLSGPAELTPAQPDGIRNFAVGFYNPTGGYTFGQVWTSAVSPDQSKAQFGEGTVTFKLLFTEATEAQVPWLKDAPVWRADVPRKSQLANLKSAKELRLLQVDVAVRDDSSKCGGWIFGTFHYDSGMPNHNPWLRLRPFALTWGNDEGLTQTQYDSGQARPHESWLNPESPLFQYRASGKAPYTVFGWGGRANGPVDNPISSCLSCHSTAQVPAVSGLTPPKGATDDARLRWFRNLASGEPFDQGNKSMDFSLQLAAGIKNYKDNNASKATRFFQMLSFKKEVDISRSGGD
jgi:hypothetical protein